MTHTQAENRCPATPGALSRHAFLGRAASLGVSATAGPFSAALAAAPNGGDELYTRSPPKRSDRPGLRSKGVLRVDFRDGDGISGRPSGGEAWAGSGSDAIIGSRMDPPVAFARAM